MNYNELSKLSIVERCKILRIMHKEKEMAARKRLGLDEEYAEKKYAGRFIKLPDGRFQDIKTGEITHGRLG